MEPGTKPCTDFQAGRCRYGANCMLAHVHDCSSQPKFSAINNTTGRNISAVADWEARLEILRWKVPPQTNGVIDLGSALGKFFRQALECVDSEVEGVMQEVIALLTSDGGLLRIEELLKQPFETFRSLRLDQILSDQLIPFFAIFTRRNVISSSMLRAKATAAYNFIYTSDGDGSHVIKLFAALATHFSNAIITDASSHHGKIDNLDTLSAVGTTIAFFSMLIELNTSAYANPGFLPIAETFAAILNSLPVYAMIEANKNLAQLQHRLSFGQALSNARAVETSSGARAAFHGPREMPGELSYKGRRHDNDHADIREISILPTLQEIQSSRSEYLPFADPRQWHLGGIAGLVDRHFRLLREDTVGQLRDATKLELEKLQNPRTSVDCSDLESQGARTHVYENAYIAAIACDQYQGPQIAMGFTRPKANCQESEAARKDWWTSSKRLMSDALICLLSSEGSATFFVVAPERQNSSRLQRDYQLVSDHEHAYVVAKPVHLSDLHRLVPQAIGMTAITQRSIVEFPRVLLPFFQPTLQAMQRIVERADIPFSDILAPVPSYVNSDRKIEVGPPTFATKPGFRYDLSSITSSKEHLYFSRTDSIEHTAALLAQKSTLDLGQAEAVVASLTRSVALVQGPPGTGKSYTGMQLIRVLLSNKSRTEIGPILVCCQTNHALDTVLERAIDDNISHVVRIGGGSKSERLKCMNLRVLANQLDLTKEEKSLYWELKQKIQGEAARISELLNAFASLKTEAAVENHLAVNYPIHHEQLFGGIHEDAYTQPRRHKGTKIEEWLHQDYHPSPLHSRSIAELRNVNIHSMTSPERRLTLDSWVTELEDELHEKFRHALSSYEAAQEQLKIMQMELNLRVLRRTNIIGVTTNGLARHLDLLGAVNIDILLCEEAGEVLEAHSLTGLLPSIKQFILIGDHQQLRPQIQDYNLSTESPNGVGYGLDISLFERLIHPRDTSAQPLPFSTLHLQRRMHPSISQLIRTTQYPHLQDDLCVSRYPEIVGMRHRLFWLDHEAPEDHTEAPSTSRSNAFEVDMIAALVQHIVHQGVYNAADIAVLTPYSGQLRKLRDRFSDTYTILLNDRDADELDEDAAATEDASCVRSMAGTHKAAQGSLNQALRLATVDNFQGEEAKIVIVSLVRSNKQNNPGFLRTPNRINVLLSRAQHGMYILGNTNTMESVPMWHDVITIFRENGSIGTFLELCCPRHPDTPIFVQSAIDFALRSPEAGCATLCEKQLGCGHACVAKCHSDMLHNAVRCMQPCMRLKKGCNHACPRPCADRCTPRCEVRIEDIDVTFDCGHKTTSLFCYEHQNPSILRCKRQVMRTLSGCDHEIPLPCHVDVTTNHFYCPLPCGKLLACGHVCQKECGRCTTRVNGMIITYHGECVQKCDRGYTTCKHKCTSNCHEGKSCPPCMSECDTRCSHSQCGNICSEPCSPCLEEKCESGVHCPHTESCPMPCAAPCTWLPCSKRCDKLLSCGCRCPSVCGEECPDAKFCQLHSSDDIKAMQADWVTFTAYKDIDLDVGPCVFTPCGHIFTIDSLDSTMGMHEYYEVDPLTGEYSELKTSAEPFSISEPKSCPECRGSLRNLARYGRIVRRALLDESTKKLTAWSSRMHHQLVKHLAGFEAELMDTLEFPQKPTQTITLNGTKQAQIDTIKRLKTADRYRKMFQLIDGITNFGSKLSQAEQTYQRVHDLVEMVRRQGSSCATIAAADVSSEELQVHEHLRAGNLLVRSYLVLLADVVAVQFKTPINSQGVLQVDFTAWREQCDELIAEAGASNNTRQATEAQVLWAKLAAVECGISQVVTQGTDFFESVRMEVLEDDAIERLEAVEQICARQAQRSTAYRDLLRHERPDLVGDEEKHPMAGLVDEAAEVREMLNHGLSRTGTRMVVTAAAEESHGTGHWYRCVNGHPFTVGERGVPMQFSLCPECGAGVGGGEDHEPMEGVTYARDIEEDAMDVGAMEI